MFAFLFDVLVSALLNGVVGLVLFSAIYGLRRYFRKYRFVKWCVSWFGTKEQEYWFWLRTLLLICGFAKAVVSRYYEKKEESEKTEGDQKKANEKYSIVRILSYIISVLLLPLLFMGGRKQALILWSQARSHLAYFTEAFAGLELVSGWLGVAQDGVWSFMSKSLSSLGSLVSKKPGYTEVKQGVRSMLGLSGDSDSDSDDEDEKEPNFIDDDDASFFPSSWFNYGQDDATTASVVANARAGRDHPVASPVEADRWVARKLDKLGSMFSLNVLALKAFVKRHPRRISIFVVLLILFIIAYFFLYRKERKEARQTKTAKTKRAAARKNAAYEDKCKKSGYSKEQRKMRAKMWIDYDQFGNPMLEPGEELYGYDAADNLLWAVGSQGSPEDEYYFDPSDEFGGYGSSEAMQGQYYGEYKDGSKRFVVLPKHVGDALVKKADKKILDSLPNARFAKKQSTEGNTKREGCLHVHDCPMRAEIQSNWKVPCHTVCGGHHCIHFKECNPTNPAPAAAGCVPTVVQESKGDQSKANSPEVKENKANDAKKTLKKADKKQREKFWRSKEERDAFRAAFAEAKKSNPLLTYGVFSASQKKQEKKEAVLTVNGEKKYPFYPARVVKSVGWARCTFDNVTNSLCANLCLNGVAVAAHIYLKGAKVISFTFGDNKFDVDVDTFKLIARDTLWAPLPEKYKHLNAYGLTNGTKMVRAGENVMMVAYSSDEAEQKGEYSVSESVVQKLEGCVDVLGGTFNERATYISASTSGNCTGPVVNANHQLVGWHNATDGVHNYFIPLTARCLTLAGRTAPQSFQ